MLLTEAKSLLKKGRGRDSFGRRTKKIANATYLVEHSDCITIRLHDTDIIYIHEDNSIALYSGRWRTKLTKERMNRYLPPEIIIDSIEASWIVNIGNSNYLFTEGFVISADGKPTNGLLYAGEVRKARLELKKKVNDYAEFLMVLLNNGAFSCWREIKAKFKCWHCDDKKTFLSIDHLVCHINDKEMLPGLIYNALETLGNYAMDKQRLDAYLQGRMAKLPNDSSKRIKQTLRRYFYRQIGFSS
jgi:hypothetical protein